MAAVNQALSPQWLESVKKLRGFVANRVAANVVDDVLGEVMLRAVASENENGITNPGAWLHRVAHNVIVDHYRRTDARNRAHDDFAREAQTHARTYEINEQEDAEVTLAECLKPMLGLLGDDDRQALELIDLDGITQREAAALLGLSLSGMKSRVQRARKKLKREILSCCAIETDRRGSVIGLDKPDTCC
ncbi:MAG: sigma-70 family RNA polymerase sigma factor [Pseudomonadota bacterium]